MKQKKTILPFEVIMISFPVTAPLGSDADTIMSAMHSRCEQIKASIDSQKLFMKVTMLALKMIGFASAAIAIGTIPIATIMFSATPLTVALAAAAISISCLAVYMFFDPNSPSELVVRDQWKAVFQSLRKGDGKEILETCQELIGQKEKNGSSYKLCLGALDPHDTLPFFHKTCLVGYLQIAIQQLGNREYEEARSSAHMALSHFSGSGFSDSIKNILQEIVEIPKEMKQFIEEHKTGNDLHALDHIVSTLAHEGQS